MSKKYFTPPKALYPDYRFYGDRSQFTGTDVHELFIGELFRSRMTWWNARAEYVRDDAFGAFLPIMARVVPGFQVYGENRLAQRHLRALLSELRALTARVLAAASSSELKEAFEHCVDVDDTDFAWKKAELVGMVKDFAVLAKLALRHRQPLWILGL